MRVTTIDGGFRGRRSGSLSSLRGGKGLGSLTSAVQNEEATAFNAQFDDFERVHLQLRQAIAQGRVGLGPAAGLEAQFLAIGAERDTHRALLATLDSPAQLMEWRSTAGAIAARAQHLAEETAADMGFEMGVRPWQIGVALVAGAALFGGVAYWLSRPKRSRR